MTLGISADIRAAVTRRWPVRGARWSEGLEGEFREICHDLGAVPVRTLRGRFAFVAEATNRDGERMVLRSSADPNAAHQAEVLNCLAANNLAPKIYLTRITSTAVWSAMEAVQPGTSLADTPDDTEKWGETLALLQRLAPGLTGPPNVPDLESWIRNRLESPPLDDQPRGRSPAPIGVRKDALELLDDLRVATQKLLCHGDMSPGNILSGKSRLWLVDPRGVNGEPAYDAAVIALKASRGDVAGAQAHILSIAHRAEIDPERASKWVVVASAATV